MLCQLHLNKIGRKKERVPRELLLSSAKRGNSDERLAFMNQEAGPHETPIWQHLYVGLSSLQKVRNNCLLFKTPVYSIFVIAAPKGLRQAVYYLDCGGDFMGIYICQIHQN